MFASGKAVVLVHSAHVEIYFYFLQRFLYSAFLHSSSLLWNINSSTHRLHIFVVEISNERENIKINTLLPLFLL